jgi:hypothetical protein
MLHRSNRLLGVRRDPPPSRGSDRHPDAGNERTRGSNAAAKFVALNSGHRPNQQRRSISSVESDRRGSFCLLSQVRREPRVSRWNRICGRRKLVQISRPASRHQPADKRQGVRRPVLYSSLSRIIVTLSLSPSAVLPARTLWATPRRFSS